MNFGLPYKGSKNKIAKWVCDILPDANTLYDLFVGGGAITHCASLNLKYNNYIVNDLNSLCIKGLKMAFNGEFKNETRWISRDDFFKLKDTDYYVACCFSFGNDFKTYAYNEEIEQFKKAMHYSVVFNDNYLLQKFVNVDNLNYTSNALRDRMIYLRKYLSNFTDFKDKSIRLQNLERLQRLNNLPKDNIKFYSDDYQNIPLTDKDAVIYCDIPYKDTKQYNTSLNFDYDRFWNWAERMSEKNIVLVSEYQAPDNWKCIWKKDLPKTMNHGNNVHAVERLFEIKEKEM